MEKSERNRAKKVARAEQEAILAEWEASGLSDVDFAEERGMKVDALYRWSKLKRNRTASSKVSFVELKVASEVLISSPEPMKVHVGDSIYAEVTDSAHLDWVVALGQKLEAKRC